MADLKKFSVQFSSSDYDAIIKNAALRKGWQEKVRSEKGEVKDNPQTPETYLQERVVSEFINFHITAEVSKAGVEANAKAQEDKREELNKKFKI